MESMIAEPQYAYMAGLNHFRNYLGATQWDMTKREIIGRTISKAGYLKIAPDTYSFDFRMELLRYLLTLDAREIERAEEHTARWVRGDIAHTDVNRELCEVQFETITPQQLVAIDFQLGLHHHCPHAHPAICAWYEIHELGQRYDVPQVAEPVAQAPVPMYGWFEVGNFDKEVPTDGLRDYQAEQWDRYLMPERVSTYAQTTDGERVAYFEEEDQLTVDAEIACMFVTCEFDERYYRQARQFSGLDSSRFLLSRVMLKLPKGMSARYNHMARRGEYLANLAARYDLAPDQLEQYVKGHAISDSAHAALVQAAAVAASYPELDLFALEDQLALA